MQKTVPYIFIRKVFVPNPQNQGYWKFYKEKIYDKPFFFSQNFRNFFKIDGIYEVWKSGDLIFWTQIEGNKVVSISPKNELHKKFLDIGRNDFETELQELIYNH
jgi:hypothetical protein